ncbi:histidine kinase [Mucilaginibacter myungsuensis]|uniref:Histidine kinase n=2 Tax=Mucilaginibacter myungsuensis TaxID=649104 RepID=A0A929KY66_9SPHI|nr:histidine kinase [Mucilaginibacter myungsuensis]
MPWRHIGEHALFWLLASLMLTFFFGATKPTYWWGFVDNLMYLPIHMSYFYVMAYWVMPHYLLQGKYGWFALFMVLCIMSSALMTRILDITVIDPRVYNEYQKQDPTFTWNKIHGSFAYQLFNMQYFANAAKGVNLVIWTALTIKFFKMWHERREAALQAELNFLKGQVHPHFLFNTLNNIYALSLSKSDKAPAVVIGLSEILKYMLYETKADTVPLKRDVEAMQNYIELEKLRYEGRLDLNVKIQDGIDEHRIAPLLLAPLVENAFKHGTSEQVGDVWINIDLSIRDQKLKFKVSNSKPTILPGDIERHKGNIGLPNVKKRLELLYPKAHQLKIYEEDVLFAIILEVNLDKHISL